MYTIKHLSLATSYRGDIQSYRLKMTTDCSESLSVYINIIVPCVVISLAAQVIFIPCVWFQYRKVSRLLDQLQHQPPTSSSESSQLLSDIELQSFSPPSPASPRNNPSQKNKRCIPSQFLSYKPTTNRFSTE